MRRYHRPGERYFGWIWISEAKGERRFRGVGQAAGWRAAEE